MIPQNVLILPGWQGSGPEHWQTRWEHAHGFQRVDQHDWIRPMRGDWNARLEDVLLGCDIEGGGPAVLVAHSLGCIHAAAWAAHSRNTHRVKAALLVAPPDTERIDMRQLLPSWAPIPSQKLPFKSLVVCSTTDPYCTPDRARQFASVWGADLHDAGPNGHLNADSGLGDWPALFAKLQQLIDSPSQTAKL